MQTLNDIRALLEQERYAEALRCCEREIQRRGGGGQTALLTAHALVGLARLQEAETWVQRARVDLPDETPALRLLVRIYRRRGWRIRAQAIERRLRAQPAPLPDDIPTMRSTPAVDAAPATEPNKTIPPTLDATLDPSVDPPAPPPPDQPTLAPSATRSPVLPAADGGSPDPLGLLTAEQADAMRSGVTADGASPAPAPAPPRPTVAPRTSGGGGPARGPAAPAASESGAGAQTGESEADTQRWSPPTPAHREPAPVRPEPTVDRPPPAPQRRMPRALRRSNYEADRYVRQRRRAKLALSLALVLLLGMVVAGVIIYRSWKRQQLRLALAHTTEHIDSVDHDRLREARPLIDEALGGSVNPDAALCARGAQVEFYLWLYYSGDRATLNQAKRLLEDAELRGATEPETRFTRALWEGFLGDPSITLEVAEELAELPGVRPDRPYLLRGVAAAATGDHALAVRHLEKATSLQPTALNHLAFAREAERLGARIDAVDQQEAILEIVPDHMAATVDLALLRAGEPTAATYLDDVETVLKTHDGLVPPRVMGRVFAAKASGLSAKGDHRGSTRWHERALEEDADNPDLLRAYAHELRIRGDLSAARAQLARIETQRPYSGDALGELALIAYLQDRPDLIETRLDDFPERARRGAAYRLAVGLLELTREDADAAADVLAGLPHDLWAGEVRLLLGDAQLAAGKPTEARTSYVEARRQLERQRGKGDPLIAVADLSRDLADVEQGRRRSGVNVDATLARFGRYPVVIYAAARLTEARGDTRRAARLYRRAFERGQEFSRALVGYVRTASATGSGGPEVAAAATEYIRITPHGPAAAAMADHLGL